MQLPADEMTAAVRAALTSNAEEIERLRAALAATRTRIEELELLADSDTLTPLRNRRCFLRELERTIAEVRRYGTPAALYYVDVNGLKAINDRHGHAAGDAALRAVAKTLSAMVRVTDIIARIGGDEFGLILQHLDERAAHRKMGWLADAVAAVTIDAGGVDVPIAASFGVTLLSGDDRAEAALARADAAMYAARDRQRSER